MLPQSTRRAEPVRQRIMNMHSPYDGTPPSAHPRRRAPRRRTTRLCPDHLPPLNPPLTPLVQQRTPVGSHAARPSRPLSRREDRFRARHVEAASRTRAGPLRSRPCTCPTSWPWPAHSWRPTALRTGSWTWTALDDEPGRPTTRVTGSRSRATSCGCTTRPRSARRSSTRSPTRAWAPATGMTPCGRRRPGASAPPADAWSTRTHRAWRGDGGEPARPGTR